MQRHANKISSNASTKTNTKMIHPIEFITFIKSSRNSNSFDRDDGSSAIATESLICGNDSKYDIDFNDECNDPTFDLMSFDGASTPPWPLIGATNLDDIKIFKTPSQPSLSRTYNSDSSGIIPDMTSYDESSSRSDTIAKNKPSSECLCHTLYPEYIKPPVSPITLTNEYEYLRSSSRNRPNIISCESTAATSTTTSNIQSLVSQHSLYSTNRVQHIKTRRKSSEIRYYCQKRTSSKRYGVQSTTTNALCDPDDTPVCSKLSSSHYNPHYKSLSVMQSMIEAAGKIICFNTSLYMVYLLIVFYKYSLSTAIQSFQQFGFAL